jgi:hypothetical protein
MLRNLNGELILGTLVARKGHVRELGNIDAIYIYTVILVKHGVLKQNNNPKTPHEYINISQI